MQEYLVSWQIEVDADTPEEAAHLAASMMPLCVGNGSTATFFDVLDPDDESLIKQVDISKE